jgi:hypothetical protein
VTFNHAITGCSWIGTLNDNTSGGAQNGEIAIEQASGADPNRLRVRTFDSAGAVEDRESSDGFSLHVVC